MSRFSVEKGTKETASCCALQAPPASPPLTSTVHAADAELKKCPMSPWHASAQPAHAPSLPLEHCMWEQRCGCDLQAFPAGGPPHHRPRRGALEAPGPESRHSPLPATRRALLARSKVRSLWACCWECCVPAGRQSLSPLLQRSMCNQEQHDECAWHIAAECCAAAVELCQTPAMRAIWYHA